MILMKSQALFDSKFSNIMLRRNEFVFILVGVLKT